MNTPYATCCGQLAKTPKKWLITGVAGFIGSNLLETLLKLDQAVVGLDNFATGYQRNLDEVQRICNRIALINKGGIKLYGELDKLQRDMSHG